MSQNDQGAQPASSGKEWWESEEFDGDGYVPGALNADSGAAAPKPPAAPSRAEREAAASPTTEAVPVVAPREPAAATSIIAPPAVSKPSAAASAAPTAATAVLPRGVKNDDATGTQGARAASGASPLGSPLEGGDDAPAEETLRASLESKPVLPRVLQWVVAILTPLVLLALAVRAVASGAFLWIEYHRPGFASDSFGFSDDQRMVYGSYGLNYINSFAGPDYLGGLVVPEGVRTLGEPRLFKVEEVAHMADVQALVHLLYLLASIAAIVIIVSLLILRSRWAGGVRRGLFAGAWVTLGLAGALGVLGAIGWERFFTGFHELFFSQGNWQFYLDDTLIRLYPPQFWIDAAVVLGSLVLLACVLLIVFTWPTRARRERAALTQSKREFRLD
ncbi:TIGR01906 family membrane protein [Galactobacter valiniphilus]|uniref:TIGR01906 family membrane protein n=1 Tax=Galactobacter valiniphilus TaxID=2676122 RepID=UPI0037354BEA